MYQNDLAHLRSIVDMVNSLPLYYWSYAHLFFHFFSLFPSFFFDYSRLYDYFSLTTFLCTSSTQFVPYILRFFCFYIFRFFCFYIPHYFWFYILRLFYLYILCFFCFYILRELISPFLSLVLPLFSTSFFYLIFYFLFHL